MTEKDIIFSPALDCYLELIYNSGLSSIRFIRCKDKIIQKRTFNATFELEEYFRGERTEFSCDLDLSSLSDFTQRVLEETRKIKYGTVATYSDLCHRIGSSAVRAVGGALGRNPVPIIIPCHRVVAKDGIGGYSCGVDMKKKLLGFERKRLANNL